MQAHSIKNRFRQFNVRCLSVLVRTMSTSVTCAAWSGSAILVGSILLSACATLPQYDATTDSDISALQKEIDAKLVQWISYSRAADATIAQKGSYQANTDFYSKVDTDLTSLELRMEAVADKSTAKLPQFFENMRAQMKNLQDAHKADSTLKEIVITPVRDQLNAQFAVLLTYELSLKGVSSNSSSSTKSTATTTAAAKAAPGTLSKP